MTNKLFNTWFTGNARQGTRVVNIQNFGAVPDWNGSTGTDNAAPIQAAIDYCLNTSGNPNATVLYVPFGRYRVAAPLNIADQLIIQGEGTPLGSYVTGSEFAFTHTQEGCLYYNSYALSEQHWQGCRIRDIGFIGVNQSVAQHCVMKIYGALFSDGGFERVLFGGFTGACIYSPVAFGGVPSGVSAYNQNTAIRDVTASGVGGFWGAGDGLTEGLTDTLLTLNNINVVNGINTAFPQPAVYDYRYVRELYQHQTDTEGGGSVTSIFRFGGNAWNVIRGAHVEFTDVHQWFRVHHASLRICRRDQPVYNQVDRDLRGGWKLKRNLFQWLHGYQCLCR